MPFVAEAVEAHEHDDENDGEAIPDSEGGSGKEEKATEEAIGEKVEDLVGETDEAGNLGLRDAACVEEDSHPKEGRQEPQPALRGRLKRAKPIGDYRMSFIPRGHWVYLIGLLIILILTLINLFRLGKLGG